MLTIIGVTVTALVIAAGGTALGIGIDRLIATTGKHAK